MKIFETHDFYLTAALRAAGFPMIRSRREGGRVEFQFEDSDELRAEIRGFFNGTTMVAALAMTGAIRDLKGLIYND